MSIWRKITALLFAMGLMGTAAGSAAQPHVKEQDNNLAITRQGSIIVGKPGSSDVHALPVRWLEFGDTERVRRIYPNALADEVQAEATCTINTARKLERCTINNIQPEGDAYRRIVSRVLDRSYVEPPAGKSDEDEIGNVSVGVSVKNRSGVATSMRPCVLPICNLHTLMPPPPPHKMR